MLHDRDEYFSAARLQFCLICALSWSRSGKDGVQVQSDHYEEFFQPELDKHGYASVYKKKTGEVGCPGRACFYI